MDPTLSGDIYRAIPLFINNNFGFCYSEKYGLNERMKLQQLFQVMVQSLALIKSVIIWKRIGIFLVSILKNHLISVWATLVSSKKEVEKIERKTAAMTLLLLTAFAAVIGGLIMTTQATETNSTTSTIEDLDVNANVFQGMMTGDQAFGGEMGFRRGPRGHGVFMSGMGNIEVSSEYTANVNTILDGDSDVQDLISQGYNVTSINPIVKNVIEADGTLATKATTALITLQNGTSGYATVSVNVEQAKVTQIVIITRTVIDKTTT